MLKFYKDKFGVHVYYAGMNSARNQIDGLKINGDVDFNSSQTCVVPPVKKIISTEEVTRVVGWKHNDGRTMTGVAYQTEKSKLQQEISQATEVEDEVRAEIALRKLQDEWEKDEVDDIVETEHEFEIIDIEYPADERLVPMRHIGDEHINYFEVPSKQVAIAMMHKLCQNAGLKEAVDRYGGNQARTYHVNADSYSFGWKIEGKSYDDCLDGVQTQKAFKGHLQECREHINTIESAVRRGFDSWLISGRTAKGLTVGLVTAHLERLRRAVQSIDTKIRTKSSHSRALQEIEQFKNEVLALGSQELLGEEENLSDKLDNATL